MQKESISLDFSVQGGDLDTQVAVAQKIINEIMNKKIYTNCSYRFYVWNIGYCFTCIMNIMIVKKARA